MMKINVEKNVTDMSFLEMEDLFRKNCGKTTFYKVDKLTNHIAYAKSRNGRTVACFKTV